MQMSRRLLWNAYATAVGALTAVVTTKAVQGAWRMATGSEPPEPTDPNTPARQALAWAVASALGIAVATVLANRFAAVQWEKAMGEPAPGKDPVAA
ncbi:MAG: DUF4235 domain-containing protein [Propionibacteriaceae bacterium]|nr:DUF4235 domain-containing protein [Propionibacteriaceae bacterium]